MVCDACNDWEGGAAREFPDFGLGLAYPRRSRTILALMRHVMVPVLFLFASIVQANDWLTLPSTYSHDVHGVRVTQYAPIDAPTAASVSNFRTSGYTHTRSSLNYGQSADNYHRVEEWGEPVRPYGEWRFPNRPFATPYPNWGPPYAGLNLGFPFPVPYGPGYGGGYGHGRGSYPPGSHGGGNGWQGNGPPGSGSHPGSYPGGGGWPGNPPHFNGTNYPASPLNPYPAGGPGSPYPVAPYYDGYYPNYRE